MVRKGVGVATFRWVVGVTLILALVGYLLALISGKLPQAQRLGAGDAIVIVVIALIASFVMSPKLLNRVDEVSAFNFRVKVRAIEESIDQQEQDLDKQQQQLQDMQLVLGSLLTHRERSFLVELSKDSNESHHGGEALATDLYRLRGIGMVSSRPGRHIRDVIDSPQVVLKDLLELSRTGRLYLQRTERLKGPTSQLFPS